MAIKRSTPSSNEPDKATPTTEETLLKPTVTPEEVGNNEETIRPQTLDEYIGQKDLKEVLKIAIQAAQNRQEPIDHLLLYGPPGLGKTTLSLILATEMGVKCKITAAPALERPRDITGLLIGLQPGDILFIDEIHRLNRLTEELLYPAMEDYRLDITMGKGKSATIRSLSLNKFTLIGATTKVGALTSPLRDRFGLIQKLRFYEVEELTRIVIRTAELLQTAIKLDGATEIAKRSRGTPRIANRLLKRVRDYAVVKSFAEINWTDRKMLSVIIENFNGGPVGLETIAATTGEDTQTIEEVYEPYLMQIGYLSRTPRGRIATKAAYQHMDFKPPNEQLSLL